MPSGFNPVYEILYFTALECINLTQNTTKSIGPRRSTRLPERQKESYFVVRKEKEEGREEQIG